MKVYRYFGGMAKTQANWLNHQVKSGWRLVKTGKLSYEFEECTPGAYLPGRRFAAAISCLLYPRWFVPGACVGISCGTQFSKKGSADRGVIG